MQFSYRPLCSLLTIALFLFVANAGAAQPAAATNKNEPNTAWASLVYSSTNGRAGPSKAFQIKWVYHQRYLPVQILRRSSQWSKIKDMDGDIMWMHNSVLGERRTAIVIKKTPAYLYRSPNKPDQVLARLAPNLIVRVERCTVSACFIQAKDKKGWVDVNALWGSVHD